MVRLAESRVFLFCVLDVVWILFAKFQKFIHVIWASHPNWTSVMNILNNKNTVKEKKIERKFVPLGRYQELIHFQWLKFRQPFP